ncbi:MAG TPA: NAD(+) synthase [Ornithinimicrobium sp.]|uniref:NAD(+) synthase n=1 Tax=Ornithinimicrobium sp. TaxID=1977084 RepID=UPI002B45EE2E|nr:NAD(+) synthase [Ornithinimicrobium sp.]HKJ12058.1 NAD(+) synthase [Ornithinimicrobium sp.]
MEFFSAYDQGFARVATCTLQVAVADPATNADRVVEQAQQCAQDGVAVAVFPELALSGYAIEDLLLQDALLHAVHEGLSTVVQASADLLPVLVVGAPLRQGNRLYNCAVVVHRGAVLGVAPKSYLPNYREFYEKRHFASGADRHGHSIDVAGQRVPFGPDLLFAATDVPGLVLHVEVCEDLWVPISPSAPATLAGASLVANLSGSPVNIGKARERQGLCADASSRLTCAYAYAAAGLGESTTDLSWDGQTMIHELGELLAESERFPSGPRRAVADIDLDRIRQNRLRNGSFDDNRAAHHELAARFRTTAFTVEPPRRDIGLRREVSRFPFVPNDADQLALDCFEACSIQVAGLEQRLSAIGDPAVVIGVSGGLDSTHALIVAAHAMDRLGRPRSDILAYTLPGFATSEHTKANATALSRSLGVSFAEIDITPAARQLLEDLDHPYAHGDLVYDVTFENVQAGLRTDYLFRLAGARGGIVLGTGDLSELALGWCTYGVGDHMSHYSVNPGVPKTLVQHLIRWVISSAMFDDEVGEVLQSILDTEITPELVPADGAEPQSTQAQIGPYELQDFHLHYVLRHGFAPSKIAFLAWHAWHDVEAGGWPPNFPDDERRAYDLPEIRRWLEVFVRRFFGFSQFKRSALPNGPKVSTGGAVSPRGDWRAPSDGNAEAWLADLEAHVPHRSP